MKKLKYYTPIIIMVLIAAVVGVLLLNGTLKVDELIAAVQDNKPVALLVILALYMLKGCSLGIPYAAVTVGCALVFDLPTAIIVNTVGTALCVSVSYFVGRFSKGITLDMIFEKWPKFRTYFENASNYSFTFCYSVHALHLSMEVQGVVFGLLRTPYWAYLAGSLLALAPSMLCYSVIGDELDFTNPLFIVFLVFDALVLISGVYYAKRNIIDGGKK